MFPSHVNPLESQSQAYCPDHNQNPDRPCACEKAAEQQERKDRRDRAVAAVTKALQKHGVLYQASAIAHVVLVVQPGMPALYLSLKSQQDERGMTVYKYRFANSTEWLTKPRDAFFTWLKSPTTSNQRVALVPVDAMPFGKYKGKSIAELAVVDRGYLAWVYENVDSLRDDLRRTLALFLK